MPEPGSVIPHMSPSMIRFAGNASVREGVILSTLRDRDA